MARLASTGLLAVAVALNATIALAADLDVPPKAAPPSRPAAGNGSVFAPPEAGCLEWTDGCRICQQPAGGEAVCSNVGLACTPQAPRCTRR
jgi:hypothetical protein